MRSLTDRHPADGTLRRLVDEPAGVSDADRAHVAGCAACLSGLAAAQQDAAAVATALNDDDAPHAGALPTALNDGVPPAVAAPWRRFSPGSAPPRAAVAAPPRRRRLGLRSP